MLQSRDGGGQGGDLIIGQLVNELYERVCARPPPVPDVGGTGLRHRDERDPFVCRVPAPLDQSGLLQHPDEDRHSRLRYPLDRG